MKTKGFWLIMLLLLSFPVNQLLCQASPGDVWMVPGTLTAGLNTTLTADIHINTGEQALSALGLTVTFDPAIMYYRSVAGDMIMEPPDLWSITANWDWQFPGVINVTGFSVTGLGPGEDLLLMTITWEAIAEGTSPVHLEVNVLADPAYQTVGTPNGIDGTVIVVELAAGDVDGNGVVDIGDALRVARYCVGLVDPPFVESAADVDGNGEVNIVDALMIAQYCVGIISSLA